MNIKRTTSFVSGFNTNKMFIIILLFFVTVLYYWHFRRSRKTLYEFSDSLPTVGDLPVLGHTHWFIGGPESKSFV